MLKLYENIKKLRKENNWTQEELAKKLGYTDRSTIAKIEAGKVDLAQSKIMEFANVFGIDAGDLMGWDDFTIVHDGNIIYDQDEYKKQIEDQKLIKEATDFYQKFENATPEIQSAVRLLLGASPQPPESPKKN